MPDSDSTARKNIHIAANFLIPLYCLFLFTFHAAVLGGETAAESQQPDAAEIVERADRIRFPAEGFQVDIKATTTAPDGNPDIKKFRVLSKGNDNTLLMTTFPKTERGQILLMKNKDLWVFLPAVSQPVRLPLSQRLTGQVANGDLARANFAGDYIPSMLRTETIDGKDHHVLELTAAGRGTTYHRVLYWVDQGNHRPFKAEFFTLSGRHIKTAYYEAYQTLGGAVRPTKLVFTDALREGHQTVLEYTDMQMRDLPDKVFTKQYLKKLSR